MKDSLASEIACSTWPDPSPRTQGRGQPAGCALREPHTYPTAPREAPIGLRVDLARVLRAAHAGTERWEEGWLAKDVGRAGDVLAIRGNERRILERCDYVDLDHPGIVASPGAR